MTTLNTTRVIHIGCEIKRDERETAERLAAIKRREQIELVKTAIREVEAENKHPTHPPART